MYIQFKFELTKRLCTSKYLYTRVCHNDKHKKYLKIKLKSSNILTLPDYIKLSEKISK